MRKGTRKRTPALVEETRQLLRATANTVVVLKMWHPASLQLQIAADALARAQAEIETAPIEPAPMAVEEVQS